MSTEKSIHKIKLFRCFYRKNKSRLEFNIRSNNWNLKSIKKKQPISSKEYQLKNKHFPLKKWCIILIFVEPLIDQEEKWLESESKVRITGLNLFIIQNYINRKQKIRQILEYHTRCTLPIEDLFTNAFKSI